MLHFDTFGTLLGVNRLISNIVLKKHFKAESATAVSSPVALQSDMSVNNDNFTFQNLVIRSTLESLQSGTMGGLHVITTQDICESNKCF